MRQRNLEYLWLAVGIAIGGLFFSVVLPWVYGLV